MFGKSMEEQFMDCIKNFQLTDLLGFAKLLKVKEEDDFEEFIVNLVAAFGSMNRGNKRKMLKLAKQVSKANNDIKNGTL